MKIKNKTFLSIAFICSICFLFILAFSLSSIAFDKIAFAEELQRFDDFDCQPIQSVLYERDDSTLDLESRQTETRDAEQYRDSVQSDDQILNFNQHIQNGDMSNGTSTWSAVRGSLSVVHSFLTYTITENSATGNGNRIQTTYNLSYPDDHLCAVIFTGFCSTDYSYFKFFYASDPETFRFFSMGTTPITYFLTFRSVPFIDKFNISVRSNVTSTPIGYSFSLSNIMFVDLTELGREDITSLTQWKTSFPSLYYSYTTGTLVSTNYATGYDIGYGDGYSQGFYNGLNVSLDYVGSFYSPVTDVTVQSSNMYTIPGTTLKYLPLSGVTNENAFAYQLRSNIGYSSIFSDDYFTSWQSILHTNIVPYLKSSLFLFHSTSPGDFDYVSDVVLDQYEIFYGSPPVWDVDSYGVIDIYFWKDSDHSLSKNVLQVSIEPNRTTFLFYYLYDLFGGDLELEHWFLDFNVDHSPDLLNFSVNFGRYDEQASYELGVEDGKNQAYTTVNTSSSSYVAGYNVGVSSAQNVSFDSLMSAVIDVPIRAIGGLLDFNFLGINLLQFIYSLLTLGIIIAIIRLFLGKS